MQKIEVSIICITYNHEKYIEKAIQGFVTQKTNFKYEILISDDKSEDDTSKVILEYKKKYPELIKYIPRDKNLGIKGNLLDLWSESKGKYIALCEGDDFWISDEKLQLQYNYMEKNADCGICFHPASVIDNDGNTVEIFPKQITESNLNFENLVKDNFISTNSVLYRKNELLNNKLQQVEDLMPLDWYIHLIHSKNKKIGFIPKIMSTYRKHDQGVWSIFETPEQLFRKWGNHHINFFRQTKSLVSEEQKKELDKKMEYIFDTMFYDYYNKGKINEIKELITKNYDLNNKILRNSKDLIKITTIVICYNHELYIDQCLKSIINQKGIFFNQIIIVDDNSTDQTVNKIKKILKETKNENIKIDFFQNKENKGLISNLQFAIAKSKGDFVALCEGDDYWLSNFKLAKQSAYLLKNADVDMCFNAIIVENNISGEIALHKGQQSLKSNKINIEKLIETDYTANFSCCFYRTRILKTIPKKYFLYKNSANWLLNLIICSEKNIVFINEPMSVYRVHEKGTWSSLSKSQQKKEISNTLKSLVQLKPKLKKTLPFTIYDQNNNIKNIDYTGRKINNFNNDYDLNIDNIKMEYNSIELSGWIANRLELELREELSLLIVDQNNTIIDQSKCKKIDRPDVKSHLQNFYKKSIDGNSKFGFNSRIILNHNNAIKGILIISLYTNNFFIDTKIRLEFEDNLLIGINRKVY